MKKTVFGILLFTAIFNLTEGMSSAHPFKASVCEINYNDGSGRLEITLKLFTDDLEECIRERTGIALRLDTEGENPSAEKLIDEYVQAGMQVRINGSQVALKFLGKEYEPGVTWCYLESAETVFPSDLSVYSSIMIELYPTQSNIVHIQAGKQKKSLLLGSGRLSGTVKFPR
jgi:hypothetical protein